nr:MAG TPA: nucelotide kinase [Caudoviricetes sp.]
MSDPVNHPQHYQFPGGAQPVDIAEHLTFNTGNAVKYLARAGRTDGHAKGEILQDLEKARWYINREINRLKENNQ